MFTMKNLNLLIGALLLITLISCKKDDTDDRDKFVGTWKGTGNITVSGMGINISDATTQVITKGTSNPDQIIFTESGVSTTANVNGNAYTYDDYTQTETIEGETVSIKFTGQGSINGNVITETGTIKIYMLGQEFPGTWSSTLNKQ
jgi:hypothetical protein